MFTPGIAYRFFRLARAVPPWSSVDRVRTAGLHQGTLSLPLVGAGGRLEHGIVAVALHHSHRGAPDFGVGDHFCASMATWTLNLEAKHSRTHFAADRSRNTRVSHPVSAARIC